jgi:hypothetical protein
VRAGAPEAAAAAALFAFGMAGFALVRRVCRRPGRGPLRQCPVCAAEAVGALEYEFLDALRVRIVQQCGQCGVWRRSVTTLQLAQRQEGTLERDRNTIQRCAERLERNRVLSERHAYAAARRDDATP